VSIGSGLERPDAGGAQLGQIEYRLARESVVREYQQGGISRIEVCDAQTELMRVARNFGAETTTDCPICEDARLVHVQFVFGPRLPPSGRVVEGPTELARLADGRTQLVCYTVEVCASCGWNHLVRMFALGGPRP
jgi:hypothetical protein